VTVGDPRHRKISRVLKFWFFLRMFERVMLESSNLVRVASGEYWRVHNRLAPNGSVFASRDLFQLW